VPGGIEQVTQKLTEARKRDPQQQLFPEITASIRPGLSGRGDTKSAVAVLKLVLLAYPDSAEANDNLATAYLKDEQKDLARQHAEKASAILDKHQCRRLHGPAPTNTAAKFVASRKKHLRK
jgi:Flp pilus assembly protein TadD